MILVDVGNTTIHFASERSGKIVKTWAIDSKSATLVGIKRKIADAINRVPTPTDKIIVCSVVPRVTKLFQQIPGVKIVGVDLFVPIKCFYNKKSIGQDRLVAAFAAKQIYPQTRMVIDFGTAITVDFLSVRGDYEGGVILPGIGSTLRVLSDCALLPKKLTLSHREIDIPRDTRESINLGIEKGFSGMLNSLVSEYRIFLDMSHDAKIVATGGEAAFISPLLDFPHTVDKHLIFKGLFLISTLP